jgi:Fe-S cluster assembly protein SufB
LVTLSSVSINDVEAIGRENEEPEWLLQMRRNAFADYSSLPAEVSPLYSKYSHENRLNPQNNQLPNFNTIDEP